jgi:DnaJ domain
LNQLFVPQVSIAPTRRRRFLWVGFWTGPPVRHPFRKPDAFEGGARSREEAKSAAERIAKATLVEIEPRWARAWGRILIGQAPWPVAAAAENEPVTSEHGQTRSRVMGVRDECAPPGSRAALLGVSLGASLAELKQAFRRRALEAHPDHGGTATEFIELQRAYEELCVRAGRSKPKRKA